MSTADHPAPPAAKFIDAQTIVNRMEDVHAFGARLEDDPGDVLAEARLEAIYRGQGDWDQLIELLIDRAELATGDDEGTAILAEVAAIYETELHDLEAARLVTLAAFGRAPTSTTVADALDSLAHRTGQWDEVIDAYMIAAGKMAEAEPQTSSELWLRIACAHLVTTCDMESVTEALERVRCLDVERVSAYLDMVESRVQSLAVLDVLVELYRRIGDDDRRTRSLARAIAISSDGVTKSRYHLAIADIAENKDDIETARWHYTEALRRDPRCPGAREALVKIYRSGGEQRELAKLLASSRFTASQTEAACLALEAASIYSDELDEHTRAINLYAFAFSQDPEHVDAALPLAERYYGEKRWDELGPILDLLIGRADELGPHAPDRSELHRMRAQCAIALGDFEAARSNGELALNEDPRFAEACSLLATACSELGDHDGACDAYNRLLDIQRRANASGEAISNTLTEMARTRRSAGDDAAALSLYESAIDLAFSSDAFSEIREICERNDDVHELVACGQRQLERDTLAERERVGVLKTIAETMGSRLGDAHGAIAAYEEALDCDPDDRAVLHQLVEYYSAAEMWHSAVMSIRKAASLETDHIRRGKYLQAAATMARHHIELTEAVELYNQALDCFFSGPEPLAESLRPSCMRAFTDLARALHGAKEFKELERCYRQMIRRMRAGDSELPELWHGLGQVYRKHLRQTEEAIESFEVASSLDNDRVTHQNILLDLYRKSPTVSIDQIDKAIERRQRLVAHEPFVAEHYRELRSLYARSKRPDEAWTAARALVFLDAADPDEQDDFQAQRAHSGLFSTGQLGAADWEELRHADEDRTISTILGLASEAVVRDSALPARRLGLRDDPNPAFGHLRQMFTGVTSALGLPAHQLCIQPSISGDVVLANVRRGSKLSPTFAIGRALYEGQSVEAITYNLGRSLTYGRAEYLLRLVVGNPADLEAVFLGASSLSRSDVPVSLALAPLVARYQTILSRRLAPEWKRAMAAAVQAFVLAGRPFSLQTWGEAVDATARRAGLLLCGDLDAAASLLGREPRFAAAVTTEAKLADLLVHSVSPTHHRLRMKLGLALATNDITRLRRMGY